MNTETLRTFILLSEIKNYTQTANRLFIAQSTVTNRILELENEIGKTLFIRSRKQLKLTEEGKHFLSYAKRMIELEECALEEISHLNHFEKTIRIGSANTIYDCHLEKKILAFMNKNQSVKLDITIGHSLALIQMLQDKVLDMVFTYLPYQKKGILCSTFATDALILVTGSKNTQFEQGILQHELSQIPYYYCDFTFQNLGSYIRDLFPAGHTFPFEIDRSASLLPFLLSGCGYSFLPDSMVRSYIEKKQLLEIPLLDFTVPPVSCYMVYADENEANCSFICSQILNM